MEFEIYIIRFVSSTMITQYIRHLVEIIVGLGNDSSCLNAAELSGYHKTDRNVCIRRSLDGSPSLVLTHAPFKAHAQAIERETTISVMTDTKI